MTDDDDWVTGGVSEVETTGGGKTIEVVMLAVTELMEGSDEDTGSAVLNDRDDEDMVVDDPKERVEDATGAGQNGGSMIFESKVMAPDKANIWPLVDEPVFMVIETAARIFP